MGTRGERRLPHRCAPSAVLLRGARDATSRLAAAAAATAAAATAAAVTAAAVTAAAATAAAAAADVAMQSPIAAAAGTGAGFPRAGRGHKRRSTTAATTAAAAATTTAAANATATTTTAATIVLRCPAAADTVRHSPVADEAAALVAGYVHDAEHLHRVARAARERRRVSTAAAAAAKCAPHRHPGHGGGRTQRRLMLG